MYPNPLTNQQQPAGSSELRIYTAGAVRDAAGVNHRPGALAVAGGRIVAAGSPAEVARVVGGEPARTVELPGALLLPGLVNAHVHLDLSRLDPVPFGGDFIGWLQHVIEQRTDDPAEVERAVRQGVELSRSAGVLTVGDIAGSPDAPVELLRSDLRGVSFVELFGLGGAALESSMRRLHALGNAAKEPARFCVAPQPHAPYSAGPALFRAAAWVGDETGLPISTHLAETREELEFVASATGPFRRLLGSIGRWSDEYVKFYSGGLHPIDWLDHWTHVQGGSGAALIGDRPRPRWLLAHCNYVGNEQIATLGRLGASVAYCPRASDYFGHRNHRYRDLLAAGVNVALGTDSILCHGSLSILDEVRHLYQRDRTDPSTLLAMATTNGMKALGLNERDATFTPGVAPGVIALEVEPGGDPLTAALTGNPPQIRTLENAG